MTDDPRELSIYGTTLVLRTARHMDELRGFAPGTRIILVERTYEDCECLQVWLAIPRSAP